MLNHLFLKFALFFIGGAVLAIGVTQVLPRVLINNSRQTAYYSENSSQVLGAESENQLGNQITQQATGQLQGITQSLLQQVLYTLTKSPAFAPVNQTTRDVQTAAGEVQSLPNEQRKAICKEICGDY